ncbi:membrane protease YdiL (CAAX protease family) [Natronobacillus azotifigens]|uniref:CPBP family intramembrane metalloprotease n=1 Tax=Natronobacillus azotifigens TaxID=472978 RepID=A0A9J6RFR7_9BACI|nr:CPBP family intramembrane metalloprotease [Natronobacillus azotifigens]
MSSIISLVFIALSSKLSWKDIGFTVPKQGTWSRVLIVLSGSTLFYALIYEASTPSLETLIFQGTMPGIEEEIVYRGILWVLIAQALPQSTRRLWGADVSWSLIITTILFGLIHGVIVDQHFNISIDYWAIITTGISGFFFGWIRAYSGSILPAIVLHNGMNLLIYTIPWLRSFLL